MIGAWIVGISLFLIVSTRLRADGYPVGPGEVMLALWISYEFFCLQLSERNVFNRALMPIPWFWLLYAVMLLAGWLTGSVLGRWDSDSGMHDSIAMVFAAAFCVMYVSQASGIQFSITSIRAYMLVCGIVLASVFLVTQYDKGIFGFEVWTLNDRFLGLTTNPNQLALSVVCVPFLYLRIRYRCWKDSFLFTACLVAVISGLASRSDALYVAWVAGIIGFCAMLSIRALTKPARIEHQRNFRAVVFVGSLLGSMLLLLVVSSYVFEGLQGVYNAEGSQGSVRFSIWKNAVDALSESPLIGFGPGAYSGLTGPFQGEEAHNIILDLALNSGVIGAGLFISLIMWAFWSIGQSDYPELFGGVCALLAYAMFHYTLRQPIFWFWLITLISLSVPNRINLEVHNFRKRSLR